MAGKEDAANLRVAVVGGGSWGTTVATLVARNTAVTLWARNRDIVQEINSQHTNQAYLPDATLPDNLQATDDIAAAVNSAQVLVMGVPSHTFRDVLLAIQPHLPANIPIISLTKGLELSSHMRMTQVIEQVLPDHPAGVLTGPNLAREIMGGMAAASVIAMADDSLVRDMQQVFMTSLFRVYTNTDVIGCELGGVLKNIIAIAVGMGDGQGAGDNTRAALMTRGLAEITRLGVALGGRPETFAGLAGMGDLIATCTSPQSRNRHVGIELAQGRDLPEIIESMFMVAEGVKSAPAVLALAQEHGVELPMVRDVSRVLNGDATASRAFRALLRVGVGAESEPG